MTVAYGMLSIPEEGGERFAHTSTSDMDAALATLSNQRQNWIDTSIEDRIELIGRLRTNMAEVSESWVAAACHAKGIEPETSTEGEEWQAGPWLVLRNLNLLERSLTDLAAGRPPSLPGKIIKRSGGQSVVPAFPTDVWDRLLFTGFSARVWMKPGLSVEDVVARQALAYRGAGPILRFASYSAPATFRPSPQLICCTRCLSSSGP